MVINPYSPTARDRIAPIPGTRIIEQTLGLIGLVFYEPADVDREWTVQALYTPVRGRALGGIRAKVEDQKGFVSFCNQRDLEVLLDIAKPGAYCPWLNQEYAEPGSPEWFGLCVDDQDLVDDLYDRELEARAMYQPGEVLPTGLEFERRIHNGARNDYIETMVLRWDFDPDSGISPDTRLETVERRWASVERTPPGERGRLWLRL